MRPIITMKAKKTRRQGNLPTDQKSGYLLPNELIDSLIADFQGKDADSLLGTDGLAGQLKKQLAERILVAELTHHLKSEAVKSSPVKTGNHRNGSSKKTVLTPEGELELSIPRDRLSSFDPQLVAKHIHGCLPYCKHEEKKHRGLCSHTFGLYCSRLMAADAR